MPTFPQMNEKSVFTFFIAYSILNVQKTLTSKVGKLE